MFFLRYLHYFTCFITMNVLNIDYIELHEVAYNYIVRITYTEKYGNQSPYCLMLFTVTEVMQYLRALSSLRGLRGAPKVPPLCRETQSLGQQMLERWEQMG